MNPAPLVSLVIPAFNPRFFRAALVSALSQSYDNLEVIVCDDSRGDEIKGIVESLEPLSRFPLRYLHNPRALGFAGNLLRGMEEAEGQYLKFLCDDDRLLADCIARQVQLFEAHADVSLVGAKRFLTDADEHILPQRLESCSVTYGDTLFHGDDLLDFFETRQLNFIGGLSNVLMRSCDVRELLPVLAGQGFAALLDFALFICLLSRGHLAVTAQLQSVERIHPDQLKRTPALLASVASEAEWLRQMIAARAGEREPFSGWVRIRLPVAGDTRQEWENLFLIHVLRGLQAIHESKVGSDSDSFSELYAQWLACRQDPVVLRKLMRLSEHWPIRPKMLPVVIDSEGDARALRLTLDSIAGQCYPAEAVLVLSACDLPNSIDGKVITLPLQADWAQQLNGLLPQLEGVDWFYLLRAGDRLNDFTLMLLAERIVARPHIACCYGDEGGLLDGVSVEPVFKPDFNLDLLRAYPYTGRALAFAREHVLQQGGFNLDYTELGPQDLLWRLMENLGPQAIEHVPEVLLESSFSYAAWLSSPAVVGESARLLEAHLQRMGVDYSLRDAGASAINHIQYQHSQRPLVSIVIGVRDQLPALERCLETLFANTAYKHYEVLIVDNASVEAQTRQWLTAMQQLGSDTLRVLSCEQELNFAALQNLAAREARGDYLLMLNPHAVVTRGDWLDALLNHGQRAEVGVVGAKLCNADGLVLHAGGVLGLRGVIGSPFMGEAMQAGGYMQRLQVPQDLSAVGADCLLVRKQIFDAVGGLDEATFTVAFSEVDLSLRVRDAGYLVVWTPEAQLVLDSPPGVLPDPDQEALRQQRLAEQHESIQRKWMPIIARDPAYNLNLSLSASSYCLEPGLRAGWTPFVGRSLPHVLALPMNKSAVGHYRVLQPLHELEAAGWVTEQQYFEIPTSIELERCSPDVVILQGRYTEGFVKEIERLKTYSKGFCIYELDDYVIKVPKKNGHLKHTPRDLEGSLRRGIARCDRLVVSTQPLADALSDSHHDIRVVPNMLAQQLWTGLRSQRRASSKPRVGWGGGTSHTGDLEVIAEVVKALAKDVEWVFFGMCPPELRPYVHEFHPPVALEVYPAKLASLNLDLALAPLEYHIFNDCKSNLRLLEYGACGYPVIVTDTQAYRGYLPCTRIKTNTTEEWLDAIRMHLADPDASYSMGDHLREEVLRDYVLRADNVQHWYNGWMPD
ncbi:glycosyltransferase [Pseudomonas akapageensis]|uniref:glycosyltransferase n=1 Tax=Pseudomonas akapageensis TaxID=2609961 RepID=UPI001407BF97